jgi:hypothetical protein
MPYPTTTTSTLLFLSVLILAFFPNVFNPLVLLPLRPFLGPGPAGRSAAGQATMSFFQKTIAMPPRSRGAFLVTEHVRQALPEIAGYRVGVLHLFAQHTSCALSLNENWDPDSRADMADALDRIVPEDAAGRGLYRHDAEGSDDMPVRRPGLAAGGAARGRG